MKQIFDWLREQIVYNKKEAEDKYERWSGRASAIGAHSGGKVCALDETLELLNEAEEKWEAEVCEWKRPKGYDNCMAEHNCEVFFIEHYMVKQFNYCPFCGKPIKISEVE